MPNVKDKLFLLVVIVIALVAGMVLMNSINNYKNQQEISVVESELTKTKVNNK